MYKDIDHDASENRGQWAVGSPKDTLEVSSGLISSNMERRFSSKATFSHNLTLFLFLDPPGFFLEGFTFIFLYRSMCKI